LHLLPWQHVHTEVMEQNLTEVNETYLKVDVKNLGVPSLKMLGPKYCLFLGCFTMAYKHKFLWNETHHR